MHPAAAFKVEDRDVLLSHLERHPFMLVAAAPDGPIRAAHAPVVIRRGLDTLALDFHLSHGNALAPFVEAGFQALLVSHGPDAYISPDWYGIADQVPTWNYTTVEAHGAASMLTDAELVTLLDDLSAQEEARLAPKPAWTRVKMSPGRFEALKRGIIGVRLVVSRLEGVFKLGQNKGSAERASAAAALGDHPVGRLMTGLDAGKPDR